MTGELATTDSAGTLALSGGQTDWTPVQRAALDHLGITEAPPGDQQVFLHVAQRTGLDPFSRQLYMISRWDSQAGRNKWTIQTGIDGFRIIADRRPEYRGQVGPEWCGEDGVWRDVWLSDRPPHAARVGVLRSDFDQPLYGVAMFREYAQTKKGGDLTAMWRDKGALMIAKCAEALALRKAFPHDLSGLYTDEEMAHADRPARSRGRTVIEHDAPPVTAGELTGAGAPEPEPEPEQPPAAGGGRMSQAQQGKIFALLREADVDDRLGYASQLLGRDITSYGQLTVADAAALIDNLEAIVTDDATTTPENGA